MTRNNKCPRCGLQCKKLTRLVDPDLGSYWRCVFCINAFKKKDEDLRDEIRWRYKFTSCPQCFCWMSTTGMLHIRRKDTTTLGYECTACFKRWSRHIFTLPLEETFRLIIDSVRAYANGTSFLSKENIIKHYLIAIGRAPLLWNRFLYEECDKETSELLKRFYDDHVYTPIPLDILPRAGSLDYFQET